MDAMLKNIEIYMKFGLESTRTLLKFLPMFFWSKIDIELSELGFLLSIASEFRDLFVHQSILKPNGRHDFRQKRHNSFTFDRQASKKTGTGSHHKF